MDFNTFNPFQDEDIEGKKYVYVISNPAYPNLYKIGTTSDLKKRLGQYQTSDPYRGYKVEYSMLTEGWSFVENGVILISKRRNEWIDKSLEDIIKSIEMMEKVYKKACDLERIMLGDVEFNLNEEHEKAGIDFCIRRVMNEVLNGDVELYLKMTKQNRESKKKKSSH